MKLSFLLMLLVGVATVSSMAQERRTPTLAPAGPNRPAGVPADYVITPFGYFHPSCVLQINRGEHLDTHGVLYHPDGSQRQVASCQYPRFTSSGTPVTGADSGNKTAVMKSQMQAVQPAIGHSWIESSSATTNSSYGKEVSTWTVPPLPLTHDGQTIFFFPGFEDLGDEQTSILQPVIGSYDGSQWSMASWNCCLSGVVDESTPIGINVGDKIVGTTVMNCSAGTTNCATWNVTTEDQTTNESTELSASPIEGQTFNWGFGAVLEVYNVNQCLDYPPNASLTIDSQLYDINFNPIPAPVWGTGHDATSQPQCNYGVTTTGTQTTLTYGTTGPGFGLGVAPAAGIAVNQGSSAIGAITITDINGFTGSVNVTSSNLPAAITAQLSPGPSTNQYLLTLIATSTAAITGANQPAVMMLTASSSGIATQTFPLNVIVNPPLTGGAGTAVNLASAYNVYGFFQDSVGYPVLNATDSLDNSGDAYSANELGPPNSTSLGLALNGVQFSFGTPNEMNTVYGTGSNSIVLPNVQAAQLQILGTGVNGVQKAQPVVVTYSDNSTQMFTQTFDDWYSGSSCTSSNPCVAGESIALTMPYTDTEYVYSRNDSIYYLYSYSLALNSGKTVKSLSLPNNRNVVILAATLLPVSTPTVTVTPQSTSITTSQVLPVTVTITGESSIATPTGTVMLAGGGYTSTAGTLVMGSATIDIPAGSLHLGNDTLTASYSGDNNYSAAKGVASVSVTAPTVTLSPSSLSFAAQNTGSTSAAQTVTLTNSGMAPLAITSIAASSNFAATNNCGSTVAVGANCTASVTFKPTTGGSLTGTLTIADNASDSPQTVSLSGTGSTVTASSGASSLTVSTAGGSTTDTIQLASSGGFAGTVNLSCSVSYSGGGSATDMPICNMSSTQVQIASTTPGTSTLTISTTAATSSLFRTGPLLPLSYSLSAGALFFLGMPRRRRRHSWILLTLLGAAIAGSCIGCSPGGSSNNSPSNPGTTTGSYSVTVMATSGTISSSVSIPLTVQ